MCQPWTGYCLLRVHVRGPPLPWGAYCRCTSGDSGFAMVAPKRCSVGDATGPALGLSLHNDINRAPGLALPVPSFSGLAQQGDGG